MNLTSGVVFSISVCAIVSFWSGVGAKRAVFPKVFRYFLFCDFCFLSLFCRLSFCHTASVLRLLFPKNAPGFTKRSHFRLQLRNELFTDSGFPKRSCLQLQLRNIFFLALGFSKQSNFQLLLSNRLVLAWFHQAEQFFNSCGGILSFKKTHFQHGPECCSDQMSREGFGERLQNKMVLTSWGQDS